MHEAYTARLPGTATHADDRVTYRLDPNTEDRIDAEEDDDVRSDRRRGDLGPEGEEGGGGEDREDQEDDAKDIEDEDWVDGAVLSWLDVGVGWWAVVVGVEVDG